MAASWVFVSNAFFFKVNNYKVLFYFKFTLRNWLFDTRIRI